MTPKYKLTYKLKFFDYWHLSSGLSGGAKLDSTVTKDNDNIPYVPGKTIKGLVREMALKNDCKFLDRVFGTTSDKNDKCYNKEQKLLSGECYFSNATLNSITKNEIVSNKLQDNLYDIVASTKIDENSIAVDDSLREIEVVVPFEIEGDILNIPNQDDANKLIKSLKLIKRMGFNRNRGLGRCEFRDINVEEIS